MLTCVIIHKRALPTFRCHKIARRVVKGKRRQWCVFHFGVYMNVVTVKGTTKRSAVDSQERTHMIAHRKSLEKDCLLRIYRMRVIAAISQPKESRKQCDKRRTNVLRITPISCVFIRRSTKGRWLSKPNECCRQRKRELRVNRHAVWRGMIGANPFRDKPTCLNSVSRIHTPRLPYTKAQERRRTKHMHVIGFIDQTGFG